MTTTSEILDRMLKADGSLYHRCLESAGFSYWFNKLAQRANVADQLIATCESATLQQKLRRDPAWDAISNGREPPDVPDDPRTACKRCRGTGRIMTREAGGPCEAPEFEDCSECGGTGRVSRQSERSA